jgi:hypothetical protein
MHRLSLLFPKHIIATVYIVFPLCLAYSLLKYREDMSEFYANTTPILYKGLECPWVLLSEKEAGADPGRHQGMTAFSALWAM